MKKFNLFNEHNINYKRLILYIILFGMVCRLSLYLSNRSLWLDEAKFALKVNHFSYYELLNPESKISETQELKIQSGPYLFFVFAKIFVQIFGDNEYIIRLVPLITGMGALWLFYQLTKKYLSPGGMIVALGMFSISKYLIYYSSDFHQYSSDVAMTVAVLFLWHKILINSLNLKHMILYSIIGLGLIGLSYPAIFVLIGVSISLFFYSVFQKDFDKAKRIFILGFVWGFGFLAYYLIYIRYFHTNFVQDKGIINFFNKSIMPRTVSFETLKWLFYPIIKAIIGSPIIIERLLAELFLLLGVGSLYIRKRSFFFSLFLPIVVTLGASAFGKYPVSGRTIMFIVPIIFIFIAEGLDFVRIKFKKWGGPIYLVLLIFLFYHPAMNTWKRLIDPFKREELRPILAQIQKEKEESDILYVLEPAKYAFRYYHDKFGFEQQDYFIGSKIDRAQDNMQKDLLELRDYQRIWVIISHMQASDIKYVLGHFDKQGISIKVINSYVGSAACLYEMENKNFSE